METQDIQGHAPAGSSKSTPFHSGTAGKFLYKRGKLSFEIDAEVVGIRPIEIVFIDPGSKALAGGHRRVHRVLRTAQQRQRFRLLREEEQPTPLIDPEQRLRGATWEGQINGRTSSQIAAQFDLDRQRVTRVLTRILQGKSIDPRFGKPAGSNYHDRRALISGGRILTREHVPGPQNEYRWLIFEEESQQALPLSL